MFCVNCGRELKAGQLFCAGCGTRIGHQAEPKPVTNQSMGCQTNMAGNVVSGGAQIAGNVVRGGAQIAAGGVKAAKRIATGKLLAIIAAALVVIVGILYVVFLKSGKPEDTVAKLEEALNNLDQKAVLECFDGQTQDMYSGLLSVGGDLVGIDLEGLSDLASGMGGIMAGMGLMPEFTIEILDVSYEGKDTCYVSVAMYMEYMGETETEETVLPMMKEGREWKISMKAAAGLLH